MSFAELGLAAPLVRALENAGYTEPTPVQSAAVPAAIEGRDLLVAAPTGSGKTAAFMLPALQQLMTPGAGSPRILVLTPTRELAQQVSDAAERYGKEIRNARVVSLTGGVSYIKQNRWLSKPYEILVATPGRLLDQINQRRVKLDGVEILILDEADRMLDMGFIDDIQAVVAKIPETRRTWLFSATFEEPAVRRLAQSLLNNPAEIKLAIPQGQAQSTQIAQRVEITHDMAGKNRLLREILTDVELTQAIVFTATKRMAEELADDLAGGGELAAALHGDMNQPQRTRTLDRLRSGQLRVLVATDVAARGIDVAGISHVINYDLPRTAEDYIHRIGRTGRAGRTGTAITMADRRDTGRVRMLERALGQKLLPEGTPNLPARDRAPRRPGNSPRPQGGFGGGDRRPAGDGGQRSFGGDSRPAFSRDAAPRRPRPADGFNARPADGFNARPASGHSPRPAASYDDVQPLSNESRNPFERERSSRPRPASNSWDSQRPAYAGNNDGFRGGDRRPAGEVNGNRNADTRRPRPAAGGEWRPDAPRAARPAGEWQNDRSSAPRRDDRAAAPRSKPAGSVWEGAPRSNAPASRSTTAPAARTERSDRTLHAPRDTAAPRRAPRSADGYGAGAPKRRTTTPR